MADLTLEKILSAVEMCKTHDRQNRARALAYPWWPYDLAFSQMEVMEQGGRDLTDLFNAYGGPHIRELYDQWKKERHRL